MRGIGLASNEWEVYAFPRVDALLEGESAVQLEANIPFDPIIDIASSEKCVIRPICQMGSVRDGKDMMNMSIRVLPARIESFISGVYPFLTVKTHLTPINKG